MHFPFGGLLTTAETERWILWVRQWLMWLVCRFPGQAQQLSDSRYLLFLWQLDRRFECWPVHHTRWFCCMLPGYYYYYYFFIVIILKFTTQRHKRISLSLFDRSSTSLLK